MTTISSGSFQSPPTMLCLERGIMSAPKKFWILEHLQLWTFGLRMLTLYFSSLNWSTYLFNDVVHHWQIRRQQKYQLGNENHRSVCTSCFLFLLSLLGSWPPLWPSSSLRSSVSVPSWLPPPLCPVKWHSTWRQEFCVPTSRSTCKVVSAIALKWKKRKNQCLFFVFNHAFNKHFAHTELGTMDTIVIRCSPYPEELTVCRKKLSWVGSCINVLIVLMFVPYHCGTR